MRETDKPVETRYRFFYPLQVRFADTDAQGVVFFGTYFTYFDEGLMAYLRNLGFSWRALLELGVEMVYVDARCRFKAPATIEEMLHVHARIGRIGNTSITAYFAIYRPGDHELIATGELVTVIVDTKSRKPVPVPQALREAITAYEGTSSPSQ